MPKTVIGAIGLAVLATAAAARTAQTHGSLTSGYRLAFLIAAGIIIAAAVIVAAQLNRRACQEALANQQASGIDARQEVRQRSARSSG